MVQCSMLMLAVLLPLAMASCPCPTAPASSKVCGSNYRTYDSQCHLDCAATPGLSALHRGPCSHMEGALMPLANVSLALLTNSASARSADDDYNKLQQCYASNGCKTKTCSACASYDSECQAKCQIDCFCGCYGIPGNSMDKLEQDQMCLGSRDCNSKHDSCVSRCTTNSCSLSCFFDNLKCVCECNHALSVRPALGVTIALAAMWLTRALAATGN